MPKIKTFDKQKSSNTESLIPLHPFVLPVVGVVASGKTTIMTNLLTNKEFYKQKFNRIIFISVTA